MNENDGSEESPGATLAIHVKHAQNLQEPDAPDGRCGEHLSVAAQCQDHHGRHDHY